MITFLDFINKKIMLEDGEVLPSSNDQCNQQTTDDNGLPTNHTGKDIAMYDPFLFAKYKKRKKNN